jgi:hypothetical protein
MAPKVARWGDPTAPFTFSRGEKVAKLLMLTDFVVGR